MKALEIHDLQPGLRRSNAPQRASIVEWMLVVALCAIPLWAGRYLPLYDIPQHLGVANAMAGVFRGDPHFTQYYQVDLRPLPYRLYYLLVLGFSPIGSIELANKLVLLCYSIAVAAGVRTMLVAFKRDPQWWLLAVPLAWSTSFFWGFTVYLIGIPLVLLGMAMVEKACSDIKPSTKSKWLLGIVGGLIYLAHPQAYLWFLFACALLLLLHWERLPWSLRILWPLLPSMAGFTWWAWQVFLANQNVPGGVSSTGCSRVRDMASPFACGRDSSLGALLVQCGAGHLGLSSFHGRSGNCPGPGSTG